MEATASLERIMELTKNIEQATAVGDWPRAAELASQRSPLVMSLAAQQSPESVETLKKIFALDREILGHAQTAQTELTAEHANLMQGARRARQYQRVALL